MRDLRVVGVLGALFQDVVGAQAVADVGVGHADVAVLLDELAVHGAGLDEVVGDVVQDREVRARLEDHRNVGQIGRAVLVGRKRRDPDMGALRRRSVTRVHRIGCISAMFEPQSTKASACSKSS